MRHSKMFLSLHKASRIVVCSSVVECLLGTCRTLVSLRNRFFPLDIHPSLPGTYTNGLMGELEATFDRLLSTALASLTQTALSFCCAPVLEDLVLILQLLILVLSLIQTGIHRMTCR